MRSSSSLLAAACAALALAAPAAAQTPLDAVLLEAEGDVVKLNKGREHGVLPGQVYDLYREARLYVLPLTKGEVPLVQSQARIGRVLVFDAEPTTARARVVAREEKAGAIAVGVRALQNPTVAAPNRRPEFLAMTAPPPVAWRGRVELRLPISNEGDDDVVYTWRVTGGVLDHDRTLLPVNGWTAPPRAGSYQVTVEVRDGAGNVARQQLVLQSTGMEGARPYGTPKPGRSLGASRYQQVRDVAFDRLKVDRASRRFVLDQAPGWGGTAGVVVESPELDRGWRIRLETELDLGALAVANPTPEGPGALYVLDRKSRTVLRYGFGREWAQVMKQEPVVIGDPDGGVGNGRFVRPVDLAVSAAGECYVLDAEQGAVQAFNPQGAFLVSFGRPGSRALELQDPKALAIGPDGVYVLDDGRKTVVIYRGWRPVAEVAVGGPEEELVGLAVDSFTGTIFVLDRLAGAIKRFDGRDGKALGPLPIPAGSAAALSKPTRLRMDATRVLWVVDKDGQAVARFDGDGHFLGRSERYDIPANARIAGLPGGGVAVLDRGSGQVTCLDQEGWILARFGKKGSKPGELDEPVDVAVTSSSEVVVLDAGRSQVVRYSRQGAFLDTGGGASDFTGCFDLSAVNDRSYLALLQQRPSENFNLLNPVTGRGERPWGELAGELTPRFGCVTGITGRVDGRGGAESAKPVFWFCDEDGEKLFRFQMPAQAPTEPLDLELEAVADIEAMVTNHVVVVDGGERRVLLLHPNGAVAATVASDRLERPGDAGVDDYGRIWVVDGATQRLVELAD